MPVEEKNDSGSFSSFDEVMCMVLPKRLSLLLIGHPKMFRAIIRSMRKLVVG